jgi:hypothetical protein
MCGNETRLYDQSAGGGLVGFLRGRKHRRRRAGATADSVCSILWGRGRHRRSQLVSTSRAALVLAPKHHDSSAAAPTYCVTLRAAKPAGTGTAFSVPHSRPVQQPGNGPAGFGLTSLVFRRPFLLSLGVRYVGRRWMVDRARLSACLFAAHDMDAILVVVLKFRLISPGKLSFQPLWLYSQMSFLCARPRAIIV